MSSEWCLNVMNRDIKFSKYASDRIVCVCCSNLTLPLWICISTTGKAQIGKQAISTQVEKFHVIRVWMIKIRLQQFWEKVGAVSCHEKRAARLKDTSNFSGPMVLERNFQMSED